MLLLLSWAICVHYFAIFDFVADVHSQMLQQLLEVLSEWGVASSMGAQLHAHQVKQDWLIVHTVPAQHSALTPMMLVLSAQHNVSV